MRAANCVRASCLAAKWNTSWKDDINNNCLSLVVSNDTHLSGAFACHIMSFMHNLRPSAIHLFYYDAQRRGASFPAKAIIATRSLAAAIDHVANIIYLYVGQATVIHKVNIYSFGPPLLPPPPWVNCCHCTNCLKNTIFPRVRGLTLLHLNCLIMSSKSFLFGAALM